VAVTIKVRFRDIDAVGHVNNAVYLTYLEELLIDFLGPVLGYDFVTARAELDFRNEVRLADREVIARASIERIGTSSVTTSVTIELKDGTVALEGRLVHVAWDSENRRSRPWTDAEGKALADLRS
jgi:acyl-CoA thioester hydrolase